MKLFDLDGTLIDSNGVWEEIDAAFLSKRGLTSTEEYAHTVGHSIFPIAAQFTKDYYKLNMTPQEIMDEWEVMARQAYERVSLKPGASEFLRRCKVAGERMALVSACLPERGRATLERLGLAACFKQLVFAQEMDMEKRNPQFFLLAAEQLGVSPGDCTMYEDAPANCAAAKAAGMAVVGVYDPFYHKYESELRATCDRYIKSFEELLD